MRRKAGKSKGEKKSCARVSATENVLLSHMTLHSLLSESDWSSYAGLVETIRACLSDLCKRAGNILFPVDMLATLGHRCVVE